MLGRHLTGLILLSASMTEVANAAESQPQSRRPSVCAKIDQPPQRNLTQQQRQRLRECRAQKPVPWVVDPTPMFIL